MLYYCKSTFCIIGHALMVQCLHNPSSLSSNQQRDFLLLFQTTRPHAISLAPRLHPVFVIRFMSLYACTCISKRCYAQVSKVLYKNRNKLMYELIDSEPQVQKKKNNEKIVLGSCMYASWHINSREVDVAVTASNRRVMRWCGYGMLWRWLLLQLQTLQNIIKPTKHKVVGNY